MSKINKLITNKPVTLTEEEVTNLSKTLSAVQTAGGGGGGGGRVYYGDGTTVSVNQIDGIISLTTEATEKLNTPIPTKVSDLTDYKDYQTVDKMSAYLTTAQYNSDSAKFATKTELETTAATIMGLIPSTAGLASEAWVTAQGYLTQVPDTYYLKTETSGKDELSAAFNDILKYNVTAAAGIQVTTATDAGVKTFGISMTAQPVVTDTTLSGYNGIAATRDGDVNNQWNIGLTQDQLNTINGKLDSSDFTTYTGTTAPNTYLTKTSADTLYQPTGDYVTTADVLTGTDNTLTGIKIGSTNYTIPTTDLSNYYTKTQVDSTFASATQLNDYLTTAQYQTDSATFALKTQLNEYATKEYANNASVNALSEAETWVGQQGFYTKASGDNDYAPISITATVNTLTAASAGWNDKVDKPTELVNQYLVLRTDSEGNVSGWTDFNANVYSKSESDGRYQKKADMSSYLTTAQYQTDSATFVTSSSNTISGTKQYALTTAGWAEVQAGSTFTGVETTGAISGTGIAGSEIGLVKSATSALDLINDQYQIDGSQYITVVPNTATKKVVIGLDNQVSNAIDTVTANANIWNNASAVSAKSHTTIDNTTNIITTENQGTSASLSAVEYKDNVNVAGMNVQQIYAVRSDGDIFACLSTTANKGTLFFVCSGV